MPCYGEDEVIVVCGPGLPHVLGAYAGTLTFMKDGARRLVFFHHGHKVQVPPPPSHTAVPKPRCRRRGAAASTASAPLPRCCRASRGLSSKRPPRGLAGDARWPWWCATSKSRTVPASCRAWRASSVNHPRGPRAPTALCSSSLISAALATSATSATAGASAAAPTRTPSPEKFRRDSTKAACHSRLK